MKNSNTGEIIKKDLWRRGSDFNLSFLYNKDGNMIEKLTYNADGQIDRKWTYEYDDKKGQVIERVYSNSNEEPLFKRINYYDKKGNKTKHLGYTQEDNEPYKETLKYDKSDNILEEVDYVDGGPLKTLYKYDEKDNLIEKSELMVDNPMMTETYEYDKEGKLLASKQDEGRTSHATFVFEKKYREGKETERKVYKNGEPDGRFVYKYDDRGNRIEYQQFDLDDNLVSGEKTDFEYDQKGNWIKKIPLDRRGIPQYLVEREIEYFKE